MADDAEALFAAGTRRLSDGDLAAAETLLRESLRLVPTLAEAHANLALTLEQAGRLADAEASYRQAVALAPGQCQILVNYAGLLASQRRFAEAERIYLRAVQADPQSAQAWTHLGVLLASCKREAEAEQCYRTAMALAPDFANARFNLAYVLLRQGRYAEGWECMEARNWLAATEQALALPRWHGQALAGKSLLIGPEAGHGDMIQFCRYAPLLKAAGVRRLSVLCHPPLARLLRTLPGVDEVLAVGDPAPADSWDYWTPPLSLPHHLQTRLETIPADIPYLAAEPALVAGWAARMGDGAGRRVGLVWKGNPRFENDSERSLPSLHTLAPLAGIPGLRFYSLQKGAGEAEAGDPGRPFSIVDLGSRITDFTDTAAIIANLDLLITVDTAAAHLAGALGKPCWVLLPDYQTDWRWLAGRDDSPWYPGVVRLFRQPAGGGWSPVIAALAVALAGFAAA